MIKHNLPPGDYIGISKTGTTVAVVWHKYPDEKPDDNRDCLVFGKAYCVMSSSIGVGYYENDEWVCEEIGDITHYAELPAPPEPKPLLADAKEGWLVTNREGHTSTIKYVDNNKEVLKYAYEVSDGTTVYVRENGMFNIINHNSNYDIIATEPLAEVGSAEWALQMMKLGKWVVHEKAYPCHIHCNMVTWSNDETPPLFTMQIPSKWLSDNLLYSGWQLYEPKPEPKPQPQYKAGDWVEIEVAGVISQQLVKLGVFADSVNAGGIEFYGNGLPVMKPLNARIIRKLDPSEVKVTLTLEGTVRLNGEDCEHFLLKHSPGRASTTRFDALDPATRSLVKNLLKEKK